MDKSQRNRRRRGRASLPFQGTVKRAASSGGLATVEGYASVVDEPYEMWDWIGPYTEVINPGAFTTTLAQNPDVAFLLNHGGLVMARTARGDNPGTMALAQDDTGLHVLATVNPARSDINDMLLAIEDGNADEMSFAFDIVRQQWSPDYMQCNITEVNLDRGDVSVVNFGANPATLVGVARGQQLRNVARALTVGGTVTQQDMAELGIVLGQVAGADNCVDAAQLFLSGLLGVPNPDDEDGDEPADVDPGLSLSSMSSLQLSQLQDKVARALAGKQAAPLSADQARLLAASVL